MSSQSAELYFTNIILSNRQPTKGLASLFLVQRLGREAGLIWRRENRSNSQHTTLRYPTL